MKLQALSVQKRGAEAGTVNAIRRDGSIPAVLYGEGRDVVSLILNVRAFDTVLHTSAGEHALIDLDVEGHSDLNGPVMVKDVQHHPIRGHVLHADLLRIDLKKKITTEVSIKLIGQSKGVVEGGVLDFQFRAVEIECLALDVPEFLPLDITSLEIGDNRHVSDLDVPETLEILTPLERAVVAIHAPRVVKSAAEEEAEAAEAAEVAEGEQAGDKESEGAEA